MNSNAMRFQLVSPGEKTWYRLKKGYKDYRGLTASGKRKKTNFTMTHNNRRKRVIVGLCFAAVALTVYAQGSKTRTLVEMDSLKVTASSDFPKDLTCDIHLGSEHYPYVHTGGDGAGKVKMMTVNPDLERGVSVFRRESKKEPYGLSLSLFDGDGKLLMLSDFNMDGQWDMKSQSTRRRHYIWFGKDWLEVDTMGGPLVASELSASIGEKRYVFRGAWQPEKQ